MALHSVVSRAALSYPVSWKVCEDNFSMKAPCSWPDFLDYLQGKVKVDEYVTHHRTLAEINAGFHDMHVSPHCCFSFTCGQ